MTGLVIACASTYALACAALIIHMIALVVQGRRERKK